VAPRSAARLVAAASREQGLQPRATRGFVLATVIVIAILAMQMGVALLGALVGVRESENAALDTFAYVGDITAERVGRHAESVTDVVEGTVVSLEHGNGPDSLDQLAGQVYQRLLREPEVRAIYVGFPDGGYLEVRAEAQGYVQERIVVSPERAVTEIVHDATFAVLQVNEAETDYDPRVRPWYIAGTRADATVWTEPFLLVDTQVPAASATRAARIDGEIVAVVGADISLDTLATVLDQLPVGEGAQAFVLAPDRAVIAAPSQYAAQIELFSARTGTVPLASDLGVSIDIVKVADDSLRPEMQRFGLVGDRYVLERAMPTREGLNWILRLEADQQQLSPGLERIQLTMAWVTGLSMLLVLIAAVLLYRVWQPLAQLRLRASTDALTGLSNRHDLERRGARLLHSAQRAHEPVVLVTIDLDNFKALNDVYGHHVGDRALVVTGQALLSGVRDRDIAARIGGDEFVVLQRFAERIDAQRLVERIRSDVSEHLTERVSGGVDVGVTAGYSVSYVDHKSLVTLLKEADAALVAGKKIAKGSTYGHLGAAESMLPTHERRTT
jgi:diguanylate cyclase (GGDEF)-like protein